MKHTRLLASLILLLFALTGCTGKSQPEGSTTSQGMPQGLVYVNGMQTAHPTSAGSYFYQQHPELFECSLLCYVDYDTLQAMVLCASPGCAHVDESCMALVRTGEEAVLIPWGDKVLSIYTGDVSGSDMGLDTAACIYQMDYSGANKKELYRFENYQSLWKMSFAYDATSLYFIMNEAEKGDYYGKGSLCSLNLQTLQLSTIMQANENMHISGAYDETLVVSETVYPTSENSDETYSDDISLRFILVSKDGTLQYGSFETDFADTIGGVMGADYIEVERATGDLVSYSIASGNEVSRNKAVVPPDELVYYWLGVRQNGLLYIQNYHFTEADEMVKQHYFYQIQSGEKQAVEIDLSTGGEFDREFVSTTDTGYIFTSGYQEVDVIQTLDDGTVVPTTAYICDYSYISNSDLWAGKANFESLKWLS